MRRESGRGNIETGEGEERADNRQKSKERGGVRKTRRDNKKRKERVCVSEREGRETKTNDHIQ